MLYEEWLEDFGVWLVKYQPSGRPVSARTAGKYISTVRAWYHRFYRPAMLGVGAERSCVADILKGAAREVPQPPPLERVGCAPADLRVGMDAAYGDGTADSLMWRAALAFGLATLSRGCEFALDGRERFARSEHVVPSDVRETAVGGVLCLQVRMRMRKDLRVLRGKQVQVLVAGGGKHVDAVAEIRAWLAVRRRLGFGDERPLFCTAAGEAITTAHVRDAVRRCMAAAGRDPRLYGAHACGSAARRPRWRPVCRRS